MSRGVEQRRDEAGGVKVLLEDFQLAPLISTGWLALHGHENSFSFYVIGFISSWVHSVDHRNSAGICD